MPRFHRLGALQKRAEKRPSDAFKDTLKNVLAASGLYDLSKMNQQQHQTQEVIIMNPSGKQSAPVDPQVKKSGTLEAIKAKIQGSTA